MFILRKITGNGGELNFALGDSYSLILKEFNPKGFKDMLSVNGHSAFEDDLYGFISYGDSEIQMLFKKQFNYIMTENGKTFKNITSHEKILACNTAESESLSRPKPKIDGYLPSIDLKLKYSITDIPGESETGSKCSDDILIDTDGTGRFFRTGYYVWPELEGNEEDEKFKLHSGEEDLICGGMKWDYLPVKK